MFPTQALPLSTCCGTCRLSRDAVRCADKVGIRLSPFTRFMEAVCPYPYSQYCYVLEKLKELDLL